MMKVVLPLLILPATVWWKRQKLLYNVVPLHAPLLYELHHLNDVIGRARVDEHELWTCMWHSLLDQIIKQV